MILNIFCFNIFVKRTTNFHRVVSEATENGEQLCRPVTDMCGSTFISRPRRIITEVSTSKLDSHRPEVYQVRRARPCKQRFRTVVDGQMLPVMERIVDDKQLILSVKNRPELYDPAHGMYLDNNHKNALWNEIGEEIGTDSIICKTRWCNIRDNFRKSLKKSMLIKSAGGKVTKHYKYAEYLQFLKKFFVCEEMKESLNIEEKPILEAVDVKIEEDSLTIDFPEPFSDADSYIPSPAQTMSKRNKHCQDFSEQTHSSGCFSMSSCTSAKFENERQASFTSPHPVDAFLAGLAPTLKTFSPLDWHLAKSEIFTVVQKYEWKTIMGDNNKM